MKYAAFATIVSQVLSRHEDSVYWMGQQVFRSMQIRARAPIDDKDRMAKECAITI
jgi:hypothetical protein